MILYLRSVGRRLHVVLARFGHLPWSATAALVGAVVVCGVLEPRPASAQTITPTSCPPANQLTSLPAGWPGYSCVFLSMPDRQASSHLAPTVNNLGQVAGEIPGSS